MTNLLRISKRGSVGNWGVLASVLIAAMLPASAQSMPSSTPDDMREELHQLHTELVETRSQLSRAEGQIGQLAAELEALRREVGGKPPVQQQSSSDRGAAFPSASDLAREQKSGELSLPESVAELGASQKLQAARIEEQQQTKVESESRYRVKISGLVLMNAFSNRGAFDVADLPKLAIASESSGSVGASVRQSILGLQVFGPKLAGAATSASISADFFGGYPAQQPYGTTLGLVRLRQASARLDWTDTSVTIGQETLFISPLSPTSYATLAEPAFSYAGNLWAWTPQVVAEHRFHTSEETFFSLSGGLLAPLTESLAENATYPGPGERSRRPAFGSQVAFNTKAFGNPLTVGVGGYASHLNYGYGHETDSWAVTSFWRIPLGSVVELSGEVYRGKAIGGLGGGIWQSVVYDGDPGSQGTSIRALNALGGWTQLKFRVHPKWELNSAIGDDNVFARDLEWAPELVGGYMAPLARNRAAFGNVIYRPKSDLLLSVEYRKVWTYGYEGNRNTADQVNVGAGVSF